MLRLNEPNHCALVPNNTSYRGMLDKVKDFVAFGEVEKETVARILEKRLRQEGGNKLDGNTLKSLTKFNSNEELAEALMQGNAKLSSFKGLQPNFRLTPPSKGFKNTKEHYPKGDLGYRGTDIKELLERMM